MNAYLFLWNPARDQKSFRNYAKVQSDARAGKAYVTGWICPSTKPQPGDIAFVQRTGRLNNGIFARGTVTSNPAKDGSGTRVVDLSLDSFLPLDSEISRDALLGESQFQAAWGPQASGTTIPPDLVDTLVGFWRRIQNSPIDDLTRTQAGISTLTEDLSAIARRKIAPTTKAALVNARVGQGLFRSQVLKVWGNCCAVTGSTTLDAIRASHIKPWRSCPDEEQLDSSNGLPLIASLDALFDAGLISFKSDGGLLVSETLSHSERSIFSVVDCCLKTAPTKATAKYLTYHRQHVFRK